MLFSDGVWFYMIFYLRITFIRNSSLKISEKLRDFKEMSRLGWKTNNNFFKLFQEQYGFYELKTEKQYIPHRASSKGLHLYLQLEYEARWFKHISWQGTV